MVIKIEKELDEMEAALLLMGKKTIAMHERILMILDQFDQNIALELIQGDDRINHLEEEVNDLAISALALLSPVASDLRRIVAGIKIASELERIADYAKNTAIYLIKHNDIDELILTCAKAMEEAFLHMLEAAMQAYIDNDGNAAFEIPSQDAQIDEIAASLFSTLYELDDVTRLKQCLQASMILRSMERSGDHTKNICEHIIYLIKGQHYDFG